MATLLLAYVEAVASFIVDMFTHMEDWNPDRRKKVWLWCSEGTLYL